MTKELSQEQKELVRQGYECLNTIQQYLDNLDEEYWG